MKKILLVGTTMLAAIALAACGDNGTATTSDDSEKVATENKGKDEVENKDDAGKKDSKEAVAKLETTAIAGGAWKSYAGSEYVNIHGAAIYTNTGTVPVSIGESQINHKAKDGSILTTETMVYSVPTVVMPGESAFVGETSFLDGISEDNYGETSYNFSFEKTDKLPNLMEVTGVKGIAGDDSYRVTGVVKNISEEQQDDILLAAALFDAEGKLLGVIRGSVDVGLAAGSEAGFELSYPEVPKDVIPNVATVEVKAYGEKYEW